MMKGFDLGEGNSLDHDPP